MKLTAGQIIIIRAMRQGWEMGLSGTLDARVWIQLGGIGKGGPSKNVNGNTFKALCDKGLIIEAKYGFPSSKYCLTRLGKTIELDNR